MSEWIKNEKMIEWIMYRINVVVCLREKGVKAVIMTSIWNNRTTVQNATLKHSAFIFLP